jgi:hypothetical protein
MDITYINSKSIKISLTKKELGEKRICASDMDYDDVNTRRLIHEILDIAYSESGFDVGHEGAYVRVFPSNDGGCELFISKKNDVLHKCENMENGGMICVLPDAENLFLLCGRLKKDGFYGHSSLYAQNDSFLLCYRYERKLPSYLSCKSKGCLPDKFLFASEYGDVFPATPEKLAYLGEHCKLLCENGAIDMFAK